MNYDYTLLMIILAEQRELANTLAVSITNNAADEFTFTNGLSSNGQLPITHYWANTQANLNRKNVIMGLTGTFPNALIYEWNLLDSNFPTNILQELNLQKVETLE